MWQVEGRKTNIRTNEQLIYNRTYKLKHWPVRSYEVDWRYKNKRTDEKTNWRTYKLKQWPVRSCDKDLGGRKTNIRTNKQTDEHTNKSTDLWWAMKKVGSRRSVLWRDRTGVVCVMFTVYRHVARVCSYRSGSGSVAGRERGIGICI